MKLLAIFSFPHKNVKKGHLCLHPVETDHRTSISGLNLQAGIPAEYIFLKCQDTSRDDEIKALHILYNAHSH